MSTAYEPEIEGFTSCWPYVVVKGALNYLLIFNVNELDHIIRIQMPEFIIGLPKADIT